MSQQRHASVIETVTGKWYVILGNFEYAEYDDSTAYGPFTTEEIATDFLCEGPHCNPGGYNVESDQPDLTTSPDGGPILKPEKILGRWVVRTSGASRTGPFIYFT